MSPPAWTSFNPVWTPGGKIVFLAQKDTGTTAYVVNRDGADVRMLYPNLTSAAQSAQVAWGSATLPSGAC